MPPKKGLRDFFRRVFSQRQQGSSRKSATSGTPFQICKPGSKAKRCRKKKLKLNKKNKPTVRDYG